MSDVDEQNDGTQHSNHVVFKRNIKHSCILLEVSNNQSNDWTGTEETGTR
jgi:hypothetical protein